MAKVTNNAEAPRGFNVRDGEGVRQVLLQPGASVEDVEVMDHPAVDGMVDSGELTIEGDDGRPDDGLSKAEKRAAAKKAAAEAKAAADAEAETKHD